MSKVVVTDEMAEAALSHGAEAVKPELHLTLTRALGMYGGAYDPPGPHRAYTYEHPPANGVAWNLGCAVSALKQRYSGDAIDVGLYLLKEMQERGLGVFEIEPKVVEECRTDDVEGEVK